MQDDINVQEAEQTVRRHIEHALSFVDVAEGPVEESSGPIPCDDPPNDDPDTAKVDVTYSALMRDNSRPAAETIQGRLNEDGWEISVNEGAPRHQLLFTATKEGYSLTVSGGDNARLLAVGGVSPCVART